MTDNLIIFVNQNAFVLEHEAPLDGVHGGIGGVAGGGPRGGLDGRGRRPDATEGERPAAREAPERGGVGRESRELAAAASGEEGRAGEARRQRHRAG